METKKSEPQDYLEMLIGQAERKFGQMLRDAAAGKTPSGYADLGKILDTIAVETWRKNG